ncbi:alpha/beta hydrolase [Achromobacter insolitus]|uniref:alpha/beta hydrolase n=1 Tax=Achromobacter insolitus TaxID=217204 RepID=UPI0005392413|nr:alpha/beta fold hydrolase [Achromobacter insolitus]AVG40528.1 alpha/beta hydrolase [Achromobacter insolitus]
MHSRSARFYSDGIKLAGTIFVPDNFEPGHKRPAILICHGRFAIKEWVPSRWTPYFLAAGYVCMVFDYRNLGESEGTPGRIIPQEEVRDVRHALTYLQCQAEVDPDRIGVLGWGLGGAVAITAAAQDARIKAVVSASGVANGKSYGRVGMSEQAWEARQAEIREDRVHRVLHGDSRRLRRTAILGRPDEDRATQHEKQNWMDSLIAAVGPERAANPAKLGIPDEISLESMEALYEFSPDAAVHLISPRPILLIHARDDHEFPFEDVQQLYKRALPPKQLIAVEGAGHLDWIDPSHPTQQTYVPQVVAWMQRQIPLGD